MKKPRQTSGLSFQEVIFTTLSQVIAAVDAEKPNAYANTEKVRWVNEAEGRVQLEIHQVAPAELVLYDWTTDQSAVLLVPDPFCRLYIAYVEAMIDFSNGEYDRYQASMALFNEAFAAYEAWYKKTYTPADPETEGLTPGSVISYVDALVPNSIPAAIKLQWLNELEGRVQLSVMLIQPEDIVFYTMPADAGTTLLVVKPFHRLYYAYLEASIYHYTGDELRYAQSYAIFEQLWSDYMRWYAVKYRPADRDWYEPTEGGGGDDPEPPEPPDPPEPPEPSYDPDYYMDSAGLVCTLLSRSYTKTTDDPAFVAYYDWKVGTGMVAIRGAPILVSETEDGAKYTTLSTVISPLGTLEYGGKTYYYSGNTYWMEGSSNPHTSTGGFAKRLDGVFQAESNDAAALAAAEALLELAIISPNNDEQTEEEEDT